MLVYLSAIESESDKNKFEVLYRLYKEQMWYAANCILNDTFAAEDAVHNAFLGIAKNISAIKEPHSKEAFAYVITAAKHSALNIVRKSNHVIITDFLDENAVYQDSVWDGTDKTDTKILAVSVLKAMPEIYRDALYLHFALGMSVKQVAVALGRSENTVKKQISRGKKLFISIISEGGFKNEE